MQDRGEQLMSDISYEQKDALIISVVEFGSGVVEPTDRFSDSEVSSEIQRTQEAVQDGHIVCMDERISTNGKEPIRLKSAGGAGMGVFEASILTDGVRLSTLQTKGEEIYIKGGANNAYDVCAKMAVEANIKLGNHIDNHAHDEVTNCGARDGAAKANKKIAEMSDGLVDVVKAFMADDYDETLFKKVVQRAEYLESIEFFDGWNPAATIDTDNKLGGITEVLSGDNIHPEIDTDNTRHGHFAEAVNHNTTHGLSNNRDNSVVPFFQLDQEAIEMLASALAVNEYERQLNRHAIYTYTVAIAHGLIKNQRVSQT